MPQISKKAVRALSVGLAIAFSATCITGQVASASGTSTARLGSRNPGAYIGKLYVPRYGKSYARTIAEGTSSDVLYGPGIGHYIGTDMPGDIGNFAIAGHRLANRGPMKNIDKLRKGDIAFVETKNWWFEYSYLATKIVPPTNVSVIDPVPVGLKGAVDTGHYMTFTSCTPPHINNKRIVAWFSLVQRFPHANGKPADLVAALKKAKN